MGFGEIVRCTAASACLMLAVSWPMVVSAITNSADIQALVEVKAAINPISILVASCVSSWNFTRDPCDSLSSPVFTCGIDCTAGPDGVNRITGLRLDPAGYIGTLSPWVGNLTALQRLAVSENGFHGPIPETLSRLTLLSQLDLSANNFSGPLPPALGALTNLQFLSVSRNLLEGNVPLSLNSLTNVTQLYLDHNAFSGLFPGLSGMTSLMILDANTNNFTWHLPYAYPPAISSLSLGNNQFAGRLPSVLRNLTNLSVLDLRYNSLHGGVREFVFNLPSLQQLDLSYNDFSWMEHNNLTGVNSYLISVDLSNNKLKGFLPEFFAGLKALAVLSLRLNLFSGPIPYSYGLRAANAINGSNQITQLYLDNNYLSGEVPASFSGLTSDNITASFVNNCLVCPNLIALCQGGKQRTEAECDAFLAA